MKKVSFVINGLTINLLVPTYAKNWNMEWCFETPCELRFQLLRYLLSFVASEYH